MKLPGENASSNHRRVLRWPLPSGGAVWSFCDRESSHLVVHNGESILIDCHDPGLAREIVHLGLPLPRRILHTHVQPWHCREGSAFAGASVWVDARNADLAFDPAAVDAHTGLQRADLARWESLLGREAFGIAGCRTEYSPEEPIPCGGVFSVGDRISCGGIALEVAALPFHGRHPVGFVLQDGNERLIFTGDLCHGDDGLLVDYYSAQENYVSNRLPFLPDLLDRLLAPAAKLALFPATGRPIADGQDVLQRLRKGVLAYLEAVRWNPFSPVARPSEQRNFGRFREILPGVFNMSNFGNAIVLIPPDGNALIVDPGPCDYANPDRERDFLADLARLEKESGLRQIGLILITHFHGDHVDMVHLVRNRYPACQVAAWKPVAEVLQRPARYNYSARLPWYGLGLDSVPVDIELSLGDPLAWRGRNIEVLHLPGHALVHAGYLLPFRDRLLACSGDSVQGNGEACSLQLLPTNHSVPNETEGSLRAFRQLARRSVDLNLGGHGSWFGCCDQVYHRSIARIERAQAALAALFGKPRLRQAFVAPWLPPPPPAVPLASVNSTISP